MTEKKRDATKKEGGTAKDSKKSTGPNKEKMRKVLGDGDVGKVLVDEIEGLHQMMDSIRQETQAMEKTLDEKMEDKLDSVHGDLSEQNVKLNDSSTMVTKAKQEASSALQDSSKAKQDAAEAKQAVDKLYAALTFTFKPRSPGDKEETKQPREAMQYVLEQITSLWKSVGGARRGAKEAKEESDGTYQKTNKLKQEFDEFKKKVEGILTLLMKELQEKGIFPKPEGEES